MSLKKTSGKKLLIVESPTKVKTIGKFLGSDYVVKSSVGHIRDLPKGTTKTNKSPQKKVSTRGMSPDEKEEHQYKKWVDRLGIDPQNGWSATYQIMPGKEKVVKELRALAKECDQIILATDMDREGEAIAWHLQELLGKNKPYERIIFNEITKSAILKAIENPQKVSINRVNAQQARRFLDRLVGFCISPILWQRVSPGLSAGRVQSVALRLVCEREQSIRVFKPEEFWSLKANLEDKSQNIINFDVQKYKGKEFRPNSEKETTERQKELETLPFVVSDIEEKKTKQKPSPPFITSTLQQAASSKLGFNIKRTMIIAQQLYERGLITYMRTDATTISAEALKQVRKYIGDKFGNKYLPEKPNFYASKSSAQEAHEAIRPTSLDFDSDSLDSTDLVKLYNLIKNQFLSSQMTPSEFMNTKITIITGDFELRAKGRVMLFDGFSRLQPIKSEDPELPKLKVGDKLNTKDFKPNQHFTRAPARYTEAMLVQELEKRGIGRPSTYVSIISTIQDRKYVSVQSRRFFAEKIGEIVNVILQHDFVDFMRYEFTADLEKNLDSIADGEVDWKQLLDSFYTQLQSEISHAQKEQYRVEFATEIPELKCPQCDRTTVLRYGANGLFIGCTGYGKEDNACNHIINLRSQDKIQVENEDEEELLMRSRPHCEKCSSIMDPYITDEGKHRIFICNSYPICRSYTIETGDFAAAIDAQRSGSNFFCHKCNGELVAKIGRFGDYFACSSCNTTRKMQKNGEPAPVRMDPISLPKLKCAKVDDHFILREGGSGLFLAASKYPKYRETRSPTITELKAIKEQLPSELQYLTLAPELDPKGNVAVLGFSRKEQTYYVGSIDDKAKRTKFALMYIDNKWQEKSK